MPESTPESFAYLATVGEGTDGLAMSRGKYRTDVRREKIGTDTAIVKVTALATALAGRMVVGIEMYLLPWLRKGQGLMPQGIRHILTGGRNIRFSVSV